MLVLNVWGSWCAPCVAEAPDLQKVWSELEARDAPVQFMGINFREDPARGAAFEKRAEAMAADPRRGANGWPGG